MIQERDIIYIDPPELSVAERMYMPQIMDGLVVTLKHLFKKNRTTQYPEQRAPLRVDNYRGVHRLNRDPESRQVLVFTGKISLCIFAFMWIRWTLPRFRFDQVMRLCWKGLVPLMMCQVAVTCILVYRGEQRSVWALVGELAVVGIFGIVFAFRTVPVTGRQEHLAPIVRPSRHGALAAVESVPAPGDILGVVYHGLGRDQPGAVRSGRV